MVGYEKISLEHDYKLLVEKYADPYEILTIHARIIKMVSCNKEEEGGLSSVTQSIPLGIY